MLHKHVVWLQPPPQTVRFKGFLIVCQAATLGCLWPVAHGFNMQGSELQSRGHEAEGTALPQASEGGSLLKTQMDDK